MMAAFSVLMAVTFNSALAEDNTVMIVDGGSSNVFPDLVIGDTGTNNTLIIRNGGVMTNTVGVIGQSGNADYNRVLVTDPSSLWFTWTTNTVGNLGSFNELIVSNSARARATRFVIGEFEGADSNSVVVSGTGSVLETAWEPIVVGRQGFGSSLVVSNGGRVTSGDEVWISERQKSANSMLTVTGPGSVLESLYGMNVGYRGTNGQLHILDGGKVTAGGDVVIGRLSSAVDSKLRLDGGTLELTNATLEIRTGTLELLSGTLDIKWFNWPFYATNSTLRIGPGFDTEPLGELVVPGTLIIEDGAVISANITANSNATVTGSGRWNIVGGDESRLDLGKIANPTASWQQVTLVYTSSVDSIWLPSEDFGPSLEGFQNGNYSLGAMEVLGSNTVVQPYNTTLYVWSLKGDGVISLSLRSKIYYMDDSEWTGTIEVYTDTYLGEEPTSDAAKLELVYTNIARSAAGDATLAWYAIPGIEYQIFAADTANGTYTPVASMTADQPNMTWDDPEMGSGTSKSRFYKVEAVPPVQ